MQNNYKNRIITISGEPVSGKSTTIKSIINKLEKQGIKRENIHLKQTGEEFRSYFNEIIELIKNFNDNEKVKELSKTKRIQKFMQDSKYRAILMETIASVMKDGEFLENFSIDDANKDARFSKIRKLVDKMIDQEIAELGEEINKNEHLEEVWLIDSRLAFANIKNCFSVRLVTDSQIAGERLLKDKNRGEEDNKYKNVDEAIEARESRREGERKRYLKRYGIDLEDESNYNLVIDTSYSNIEDIADTILECEEKYKKGEPFKRKWNNIGNIVPEGQGDR